MTNQQLSERNARQQRYLDENAWRDGVLICNKCNTEIYKVIPCYGNGFNSYTHSNPKWNTSHDAEVK